MANQIITRVQVEGNDVVSFLNGTNYVRGMSQILPQNPTYISYRYDSITISQVAGEAFTFTVYTVTDVGGNTFPQLTFQDPADVVQAKTIEIYRLLVTSIFKGCCECGNTEPECSIQYTASDPGAPAPLAGEFVYAAGSPGSIAFNYITGNNQDFTGFFPLIQDGSWVFLFSKTDPTVYAVIQVSGFTDQGTYAKFDAIELNSAGVPFTIGTIFCVDFTSIGGSLVQGLQDTLDINSILDKDNAVDGAGFNFVFDNNESFTINSAGGSVETDATGASLNAGSQQVLVTSGYIDIITPNHATAGTGWVIAKTAAGHIEYVEAGTGTISSIELLMPPAFTVSDPNPLITDGTFTVTVEGTEDQYINGLGELATFPIYTVNNGLHTQESPADPFVFHLGGTLIEDTPIITTNGTTQYVLGISGTANQNSRQPLAVSNLGDGGVATFQDYGSGFRPNPSVEIVGDVDLFQPLLELRMEGNLPNPSPVLGNRISLLRLTYDGAPANARTAIDFSFKNNDVSPNPTVFPFVQLSAQVTNFNANAETADLELLMVQGGSQQVKLLMEGKGQLTLNEYGPSGFSDATTNINNSLTYVLGVDGTGKVWKKLATGGGTVQSVSGTGLITTSPNPITTTGTVTTSVQQNRLVGRWDAGGTGIMQEITLGTNLDLTALGVLNASGGGFDVQVNTTTIIPPATILNLKSGTGVDVIHEGSGAVRFDFSGTPSTPGLQDVIIEDNVLTQNNTIEGSLTSFVWKSNSFYEINPTLNYDPGTGTVPGYFKAWVGKYPPSYSELYVEAIYAQMKSEGATDQIVKVDTTGVYVQTPGLGSATVGQVLTLQNATTGQVEYQDAGGGTYDSDQGIYKDTTLTNDTFQLGAPSGSQAGIAFSIDRYIDTTDQFLQIEGVNGEDGSVVLKVIEGSAIPIDTKASFISATQYKKYAGSFTGHFSSALLAYSTANDAATLEVVNSASSNGLAAKFQSDNGGGITVESSTGSLFRKPSNGLVSGVDNIITVNKLPAGAGAIGEGVSIKMEPGHDDAGTTIPGGVILNSIVSDATTAASVVDFRVDTLNSNTPLNHTTFIGDGQLRLHEYGRTPANFPDAAPVWALGVDGNGNVVEFDPGGGSSPLTTKGDIYTFSTIDARLPVGTNGQILYADSAETTGLKWGDAPSAGGGSGRSYYLNGSINQGTFAGIAMKQMSPVPVIGVGTDFSISSNGYIQSFITDAGDPNKAVIPAGNWNFELWFSASSGGGSPNFYVELYKYDTVALTLTPIASSITNPEGITNGTTIDLYFTALSVPQTTLALTDRLAVRVYVNNGGGSRTITLHTQGPHLSQIITDFPSGIVSLNGLTAFAQTFATPGTTGTAPAWLSSTSIHTLNIPFASASGVTAGLISKTEYDVFNAKQDAITGAATTITTADLTVNKALISNASGKVAVSSSTVGYSLATLADPNAIRYVRINADNSVTAITAAQLKSELLATTPYGVVAYGSAFVSAVPTGATTYGTISSGIIAYNANIANREFTIPFGGTVKNLYLHTSTGQLASGSLVVTVMQNQVATSLAVTVPASSAPGTRSNLTDSFTAVAGDKLVFRFVNGATNVSATVVSVSFIIEQL
jgi:hypothetical protein